MLGIAIGLYWHLRPTPADIISTSLSNSFFTYEEPTQYNQQLTIAAANYLFTVQPLNAQAASKTAEGNIIKYIEAYANTDVVQTRYTNKLKEDIILKQPGHPDRFEYQINLSKYDFAINSNGDIVFYVKGKRGDTLSRLFTIPAPFMIDATGTKSKTSNVKVTLTDRGILTIEPNKDWLQKATYPVTLDPTIEINILNVYSHPQQGEDWTVNFTTQGQADLKIIPNDQATIDDDEFTSLSCDGQTLQPQILAGDVIFYPNWQCLPRQSGAEAGEGIGQVIHKTLTAGKHTLRFEFGPAQGEAGVQTAFAYNDATASTSPGTAATDSSVGTANWNDPTYALTHNSQYAYATLGAWEISYYLEVTNFGFDIPPSATINGIMVEVEKYEGGLGYIYDNMVSIVKGGVTQGGGSADPNEWPSSPAYRNYGTPTNLWGQSWTACDINSPGFGFGISAEETSGQLSYAYIDHIRMKVFYTPSGGSCSTASTSPGTVTSVLFGGPAWDTPSNAVSNNTTYTWSYVYNSGSSDYLEATNFDFSSIPDNATINGIVVEVKRYGEVGVITDSDIRLIRGGTIQGDNKADIGTWPTSDPGTYKNYGGPSDLWGLTNWTAAQVKSSDFGVAFAAFNSDSDFYYYAYVDHIRMRVFYTPTGGGGETTATTTVILKPGTIFKRGVILK